MPAAVSLPQTPCTAAPTLTVPGRRRRGSGRDAGGSSRRSPVVGSRSS